MSRIISFAWTTPALLAGRKTVTRRDWADDYARRFRPGDIVQAYDRSPRNGGRKIADLRIVSVTKERNGDMSDADWEGEGFAWFCEQYGSTLANGRDVSWEEFDHWRTWHADVQTWVIRFEVIAFEPRASLPASSPSQTSFLPDAGRVPS